MNKQKLNTGWEYTDKTGFAAMFNPNIWQPVVIPHDAMIGQPRHAENPSGSQGGYFPGGIAHYRKKMQIPEEWRGQSIQLEFDGVYMNAEISINGELVYIHPYGYTGFFVDLTDHLKYGEENTINVVANNTAQPNSRWYSGTGIYRNVWLRTGNKTHIKPWGVFVTTPVVGDEISVVQIETEMENLTSLDGAYLRTSILDAEGNTVASITNMAKVPTVQQTLLVSNANLWSTETPYLYTLLSELLIEDKVIDSEKTTFGIRSIQIDTENGLLLNGVPLKMKGGCIHHDHGPLGAAAYERAEERKLEILKSAGYNAIRSAHNPPSSALLDACDRLGMLVIDETFDAWTSPKATNDYHLYFKEWWQRDTEAMIKRDRNHPSVILWSIGNEIFESLGSPIGTEWSRRQADFVRSLDSSRYVTSGIMLNFIEDIGKGQQGESFKLKPVPEDLEKDSWARLTADFIEPLDVTGYNYMAQRYKVDRNRFPNRVIAGTETWGHMMFTFWKETVENPQVIGDFVWTAIDYIGEAGGGQVSFDGSMPHGAPFPYHLSGIGDFNICGFKRPQSYYRDLLWGVRKAPFIAVVHPEHYGKPMKFTPWAWEPVLDTWTFPGQEGNMVQVDVYSIDEEIELRINGVSAGRQPAGEKHQNKTSFSVEYQPGTIEAIGYTQGKETNRTSLVTTGEAVQLKIHPDKFTMNANAQDLIYLTIEILDTTGKVAKHSDTQLTIAVDGPAELIGIGSGNPNSEELYIGNQHKTFQGRLLAILRSTEECGEIAVTAQAEGLKTSNIQIKTQG